jgi:hypothetical protein
MIDWEKPSGKTVKTNESAASIKMAESLNWKRSKIVQPEVGKDMGEPGSDQWHINTIACMKDEVSIKDYVGQIVSNSKLPKTDTLEELKLKAIALIKGKK